MVMWHIHQWVDAHAWAVIAEVGLVRVDRMLVCCNRVVPPAHSDVDVCRHVNDVASSRHQPREPLGTWYSPFGMDFLDRVNVEMAGARMIWVLPYDALECRHHLPRAGSRLALSRPVVPGHLPCKQA
jgi:hypothetical protein